jgi:CRP-like cAMP-binding protein
VSWPSIAVRSTAASSSSRAAPSKCSCQRTENVSDLFGEVGFFDGLQRTADVVALEAAEALVLHGNA